MYFHFAIFFFFFFLYLILNRMLSFVELLNTEKWF